LVDVPSFWTWHVVVSIVRATTGKFISFIKLSYGKKIEHQLTKLQLGSQSKVLPSDFWLSPYPNACE